MSTKLAMSLTIKNFNGVSKVDWSKSKKAPLKIKISYDVIKFIVSALLESFVYMDGRQYIKLLDELQEITKDSSSLNLSLLISGAAENNTGYLKNKPEDTINFRIEFLRGFINEILKPLQGSFAITKVDINIGVKIHITFKH